MGAIPTPLRGVTFDCWSTLIYDRDPGAIYGRRVAALVRTANAHGLTVEPEEARRALGEAWSRHVALWQQGVASGSPEMAGWALETLARGGSVAMPGRRVAARLATEFAEAGLDADVAPLAGAHSMLARLAGAGIRRALICDTGFSPGTVVRRLLERAGLLAHLEVTVFSDEAGVPKPHPRVFQAALAPLGLERNANAVVHVGDLRRTDVGGARAAGMRTVRIRGHHDDDSELPDADHVVDSHADLLEVLGLA